MVIVLSKLKPKIGFLISKFNHGGGTERVTTEIANGLSQRGYDINIISCQKGFSPIFDLNKDVKLFSLHGELVNNSIKRKISNLKHLKSIIKQQQIDILITVDVELYIYAFPLQLMKLCKVIAWEHFNYFKEYGKLEKLSQYLAARYSNELIVISHADLKNYKANVKHLTKTCCIYNPLPLISEKTSNLSNKRVLAVGRLEKQKGFDLLLEAWKYVEKENNQWNLDIFGNGTEKDLLLQQIDYLNLKRVKINDYSESIQKEYLNSSIYVLSSRYEGFGLVLLEAQEFGLPTVSFDCPEGPSEIIDNGQNGFLIENFDTLELGKKILKLINNRTLLENFAKNARNNLDRFNIVDILNKWEDVINNL